MAENSRKKVHFQLSSIAIIAITTRSSIRVNVFLPFFSFVNNFILNILSLLRKIYFFQITIFLMNLRIRFCQFRKER